MKSHRVIRSCEPTEWVLRTKHWFSIFHCRATSPAPLALASVLFFVLFFEPSLAMEPRLSLYLPSWLCGLPNATLTVCNSSCLLLLTSEQSSSHTCPRSMLPLLWLPAAIPASQVYSHSRQGNHSTVETFYLTCLSQPETHQPPVSPTMPGSRGIQQATSCLCPKASYSS